MAEQTTFKHMVGVAGDTKILRFQIPGWEKLTKKQKNLLWCLYNATLWGRDIYYDQNFKYGLYIRRTFEKIIKANLYVEPPSELTEDSQWSLFMDYVQSFWIHNGPHHNTHGDKLTPKFTQEYFIKLMHTVSLGAPPAGCDLLDVIFNPKIFPKKKVVNSIEDSATNFYVSLTSDEVRQYYQEQESLTPEEPEPLWHGLNSQLVRTNEGIINRPWYTGGMYAPAIHKMVEWLTKALTWAENPKQREAFEKLIAFYKTGSLRAWNDYCKAWLLDTDSTIDMIHGFIETYDDPIGKRGSFEGVVTVRDPDASVRIHHLQNNAQWFEDNAPIMDEHRRPDASGVMANVVNVVIECGDSSPVTPIGINLPNAEWLREKFGSKSVNLDNIVNAYNKVSAQFGVGKEFYTPEAYTLIQKYGDIADKVHTDMHEVIGHGAGRGETGVGAPADVLGGNYGIMEEARADLYGHYFIMDPQIVEWGILPHTDAAKAAYNKAITNGMLIQLCRVELGATTLTQTHMRDRQLIAQWVFEHAQESGAITKSTTKDKQTGDVCTFFKINDYDKIRELYGELLHEIQRIKSQGDRTALDALVEKYGTHIDKDLHGEAKRRFDKFNMAPMSGFIQPELTKDDKTGEVNVSYTEDFTRQMLFYGDEYSVLPNVN